MSADDPEVADDIRLATSWSDDDLAAELRTVRWDLEDARAELADVRAENRYLANRLTDLIRDAVEREQGDWQEPPASTTSRLRSSVTAWWLRSKRRVAAR